LRNKIVPPYENSTLTIGKYEDPYLGEAVLRTSKGLYSMAKVIAFNIIISEMAHHATYQYC